jgi:hypothetical protein
MDQTADLWIDLDSGVESFPPPPVETRVQVLPLGDLTWENFERLCYRLASRSGDVSECRRYGTQGQGQQGIDIYIRRASDGGYSTWQCKRYRHLTPGDVKEALDRFLQHDWAKRSRVFSLAVTVSLSSKTLADAVEEQAQRCRQQGIEFIPLDTDRLSAMLKDHGDLVDDFFGREWARAFCGSDAVHKLSGRRLTKQQRIQVRHRLRDLYATHFASTDFGLAATGSTLRDAAPHLPLQNRYIVPHVQSIHAVMEQKPPDKKGGPPRGFTTTEHKTRLSLLDWLVTVDHAVIMGGPGLGKSAALRFLAMDLLSEQPRTESVAKKWGSYLPLLVPFALLTQLVAKREAGGIEDFLRGWLRRLGVLPETFTLFEQALNDERLLLLIDGLDEWSDPIAARAALTAIFDFAGPRRLPVIASARRLGYERLGGLGADWTRAELLPFEDDQQHRFAEAWFAHFYRAMAPGEESQEAISSAATRDTESFMTEVKQDRAISELAGVPLLLSALIYLRWRGGVLPRNRFDAIDALTKALISEQPTRRAVASLRGSDMYLQNPRVAEQGLQFLALFIHEQPGSESIPEDEARSALATFYQGPGCRKPEAEAIELAATQVERATHEIGVLVERQPEQIGFLHRSFQEFLAAKEIARRPFVEARQLIVNKSSEPGWQEILLTVLHFMRQDEVDAVLVEVRKTAPGPLELLLHQTFLARAVFTDLNCSGSIAVEIAEEIFSAIEMSAWMPLRKALLFEAIQGLDSEVLGNHVRDRLRRWFPQRQEHRFRLFRPLAEAPIEGTGRRLLVALINAEYAGEQREIAEAIAAGAETWPNTSQTLADILTRPADDDTLAAALHALALGWPQHSQLQHLLLAASESRADSLRCVALIHRVRMGETSPEVKHGLMELCEREHHLHPWVDEVLKALREGWRDDAQLRKAAIESSAEGWWPAKWDRRLAVQYLVKTFPGDNDVADIIAGILKNEDHLRVVLDPMSEGWEAVLQGFRSHPHVVPAAEAWLQEHGIKGHDVVSIAQVAMLARTEVCKQILIDRLKAGDLFPQWIFHALLDLGGSDDPEAKEAMLPFIAGAKAASVAHYLPQLISDPDDCYRRLLDLLKDTNGWDVAHVLEGLDKLGRLDSPEVIAVVEKRLQEDEEGRFWFHAKGQLWKTLSQLPLVRQGALKELELQHSFLSAVASAYAGDKEIRPRLEELMEPLHGDLRLTIAQSLRSFALRDDPFARDLLALYTLEWNGEARTAAADAYYTAVRKRGGQCKDYTGQLWNELSVRGLESEVQQAALAGLVALGETGVILKQGESGVPAISTYVSGGRNWEFIRIIEENWASLSMVLRDAVWKLFRDWHIFVWHPIRTGTARLSPPVPASVINEARAHAHEDIEAFWVLASLEKGQDSLREFCLNMFRQMDTRNAERKTSWGYKEEQVWIEAGHYLGVHYANDAKLAYKLEELARHSHEKIGPVVALCRGWPQADLITDMWQKRSSRALGSDPETAWIVNVRANVPQFVDYILSLPAALQKDSWAFPYETLRAVRNRLVRDTDAQETLFRSIETSASPDILASIPGLLSPVARNHQALRDWANRRIVELRKKGTIQPMGYNMLSRRVQPLELSILDACEGT